MSDYFKPYNNIAGREGERDPFEETTATYRPVNPQGIDRSRFTPHPMANLATGQQLRTIRDLGGVADAGMSIAEATAMILEMEAK